MTIERHRRPLKGFVIAALALALTPAASQAATQSRDDPSDAPPGTFTYGKADLRKVVWDVGATSATVTVSLDASTFGGGEPALIRVHLLLDTDADGIADHEIEATRNADGVKVDLVLRNLDGTLSSADCQDLDGKPTAATGTVASSFADGLETFAFSFDPTLVSGNLATFRWAAFAQAAPDASSVGPWDYLPDAANPDPAAANPGDRRCDSAKSGVSVRIGAGIAFPDPTPPPPPPPPPQPEPLPPPQYYVSNQAPEAGQRVVFDASAFDRAHGGARRYRWDLDGDGSFERNTHQSPAVSLVYGKAGRITAALEIVYGDGTTTRLADALDVKDGPQPAGCADYCHVAFPFTPSGGAGCRTSVEVGLVLAEADCFLARGRTLVATHRVRLNGLDLYVAGAGEIVIDPVAGTVDAPGFGTLQYGEFILAIVHDVHWSGLEGDASGAAEMPNIIPGPTARVEGFGITGRLVVTFHHHSSTFDAHVALPEDMGDFDAQLRLGVTAENPATLDELHIGLPVGKLQDTLPINNLELDYQAAANAWSGSVGVDIGDYSVTAGVGFHLDPELGLDNLSASIGGLNVSIYAGVFLDEIRFGYATAPAPSFTGGITLTYGPSVRGVSLVSAEGNFTLTFSDPAVIHIDGEGKVLGLKVAAVDARYSLDGNLTLDASLRLGIDFTDPHHVPYWEDGTPPPPAHISGEVHGWADGPARTFSSTGSGEACLGLCVSATVLMSSTGVAGCGRFGPAVVGAGYTWSTGRYEWFGGACDLAPWAPSPRAAQSPESQTTIGLPPGLPVAAFKIAGIGAAPHVTITGPHGERVVTPPGTGGARTATSLVALDDASRTTYVAVARPSGGTWRIAADVGSVPIASATAARALPPVSVHARIGGKGPRRTLSYGVTPIAGQKVTFAEQRRGRVGHVIGLARGARGRLRFTPGAGPAGTRTIVAEVSQGGLPRASLIVARYRAPAPLRPGRPRGLKLRRTPRTLRVTWRPSSGRPRAYEVLVTTINHRRELFRVPARHRRVAVRDVRPADRAVVTVTPLDATHQPGRSARAVARARLR